MLSCAADYSVLSLESILENPSSNLFKDFANYLHQQYCLENLEFWIANQEYYKKYAQKQHRLQCEDMINLYIRPNSPQEINIPCDMRQSILDFYNKGNCHLHIFDDAAEAVLELMRVNAFLPWATSALASPPSPTGPPKKQHQHQSWPSISKRKLSVNNSTSSTSLSGLSSSFSFTDKWNIVRLKQMSRRSCSSLDLNNAATICDVDNSSDKICSVSSAMTTSAVHNYTRYRSILKRVKRSLLLVNNSGSNNINKLSNGTVSSLTLAETIDNTKYSKPSRASFSAASILDSHTITSAASWISWRKPQR